MTTTTTKKTLYSRSIMMMFLWLSILVLLLDSSRPTTASAAFSCHRSAIVSVGQQRHRQQHRQQRQFAVITATTTTPEPFFHDNRCSYYGKSSSSSSSLSAASTAAAASDDDDGGFSAKTTRTTPLRRMRLKKVKILKKRRAVRTGYLLSLWYVLSIGYNIYSKKALNLSPSLAWTTAALQMAGGLFYVAAMWCGKIRKPPRFSSRADVLRFCPVAVLHSLVHIGGVISMGAGAVSFTYIVKASEPAVSAALATATGIILPATVYLTLFPIMGGVALASVSELTFTWKSFNYAMLSNLASASRAVAGKQTIDKRFGVNMTAANLYAVLTILSSVFLIPLALSIEGSVLPGSLRALRRAGKLSAWCLYTAASAVFYYTYNEVAFLALDNLSTVSHAIANTVKRVFIIVSSMLVFGNKMTVRGVAGSVLAVGGVLLYSLEKSKYNAKKTKKKQ